MPFTSLLGELHGADGWNLCCRIAGLQLLPENAPFRERLEAAIHVAASLPQTASPFRVSEGRLRTFLASPGLSSMSTWLEDPVENLFTSPALVLGSQFLLPADPFPAASYAFNIFAAALEGDRQEIPQEVLTQCRGLMGAVAILGDRALARAAVTRESARESVESEELVVPLVAARRAELTDACLFTMDELVQLCDEAGFPPPFIWPLITTLTEETRKAVHYENHEGGLGVRPILRSPSDDRLLIALPGSLCTAAVHAVISIFTLNNCMDELILALTQELTIRVNMSALELGLRPYPSVGGMANALRFELDDRRSIALRLAVDPFDEHDEGSLRGQSISVRADLEQLVREVDELQDDGTSTAGILLVFTVVNGFFADLSADSGHKMWTVMPVDLFVHFSALESGNPGRLWYYLRDQDRAEAESGLVSLDPRDTLGFYSENGYSFYSSDGPPPTSLLIVPGGGISLLRRWDARFDRHVKNSQVGHGWVSRRWEESTLPVYAPLPPVPGLSLVEFVGGDLWVMIRCEDPARAQQLADVVTYWLARLERDGLSGLAQGPDHVLLVEAPPLNSDFTLGIMSRPGVEARSARSALRTLLALPEGVPQVFSEGDELGEFALVAAAVQALTPHLYEEALDRLTTALATGCRMIRIIDTNEEISADFRGVPAPILIEPSSIGMVLDSAGVAVAERVKGRGHSQIDILNSMVGVLFGSLKDRLGGFSALGRTMWLVEKNESLTAYREQLRLSYSTRVSCFSRFHETSAALADEREELDSSSVSCRFLIELSTCVPSGGDDITREAYDELLAISSQIVNFGTESDLVYYGLADLGVSLLESGRVGRRKAEYSAAVKEYASAFLSETSGLSRIDGMPGKPQRVRTAEAIGRQAVIDAIPNELGISLNDLRDAFDVLLGLADSDIGVTTMPRPDVVSAIGARVGCCTAETLVRLLELAPRRDLMHPPDPYSREDVYPWRFNRGLAHSRRPLVGVPGSDELVWGRRHLARAIRLLTHDLETSRYKARTPEMRTAQGVVNDAAGASFNWTVAACLREWFPGSAVWERFEKAGAVHLPRELGDIDALWAEPKSRTLVAVECKHIRPSRNPAELANEMSNLMGSPRTRLSHLQRHARRVEWLRLNAGQLVLALGLDGSRKWNVYGLLLTSVRPLSTFLKDAGMPVLTLRELSELNFGELVDLLERAQ